MSISKVVDNKFKRSIMEYVWKDCMRIGAMST